jgi:hypothetical protein
MPIKRIRVICHEPIAVSRQARQRWADVYLRFTTKPGRRIVRLGPTLMARADLLNSIESAQRMLSAEPHARHASDHAEWIRENEALLERLAREPRFVETGDAAHRHGIPNVYTRAMWIDRAEAEAMLRVVLRDYGITACRFDWRRPTFIANPV